MNMEEVRFSWESDTFIYATNKFIKRIKFEHTIETEISIDDDGIKNLLVIEKIPQENSFGDKVEIDKYYLGVHVENSEFTNYLVEDGAKFKYIRLLGMTIWDLLGSEQYRSNLVEEIGIKQFKEFRNFITIAGLPRLYDKRFVVFIGDQKVEWENKAIIIFDTLTGKEMAIR